MICPHRSFPNSSQTAVSIVCARLFLSVSARHGHRRIQLYSMKVKCFQLNEITHSQTFTHARRVSNQPALNASREGNREIRAWLESRPWWNNLLFHICFEPVRRRLHQFRQCCAVRAWDVIYFNECRDKARERSFNVGWGLTFCGA